jgi:hypothetical protein
MNKLPAERLIAILTALVVGNGLCATARMTDVVSCWRMGDRSSETAIAWESQEIYTEKTGTK